MPIPKPIKVVLINTMDLQGGAAVACNRLHEALLDQDIQSVRLVQSTSRNRPEIISLSDSLIGKWRALFREYWERLIFILQESSPSVRFQFSLANTGADLAGMDIVKQADVIHLHWVNKGMLSLDQLGKLAALGKPIVWTLHDAWPFTGGCHYPGTCTRFTIQCGDCPFLKNPGPTDLSHRIWRKKTHVFSSPNNWHLVGCSQWIAEQAGKASLTSSLPVSHIPNPIDIKRFAPADRLILRKTYGLDPDAKYILFLSANIEDPRKGFAYFKDALTKINYIPPGWKLLLVGKNQGDFPDLPIAHTALGAIPSTQIEHVYQAADLFVIPSLEDNLPNTVMEAMACGTPVLGFATGGIPEMIEHLSSGYLAETGNSSQLAAGFDFIFRQPEILIHWGDKARERVLQRYTYEKVAVQYMDLYQSLLGTSIAGRHGA